MTYRAITIRAMVLFFGFLLAVESCARADSRVINLENWGGVVRKHKTTGGESCIRCVTVSEQGSTAVGFVTRERQGLVTRELPALTFHVLVFSTDGALLHEWNVPTSSWRENEVVYGPNSLLLVRTGEFLHLLDAQGNEIAKKEISLRYNGYVQLWNLWSTPDRHAFVLFGDEQHSMEILDSITLKTMQSCTVADGHPISVSNNKIMIFEPQLRGDALLRRIRVRPPCATRGYSYQWHGDPSSAVLLDDEGVLIAGNGHVMRAARNGVEMWSKRLNPKEMMDEKVAVDSSGTTFAIAVRQWSGGSSFLDIGGQLKAINVEVRNASDGKVKEVVNAPGIPIDRFDFALAPDGHTLAVLSDMRLFIEKIN